MVADPYRLMLSSFLGVSEDLLGQIHEKLEEDEGFETFTDFLSIVGRISDHDARRAVVENAAGLYLEKGEVWLSQFVLGLQGLRMPVAAAVAQEARPIEESSNTTLAEVTHTAHVIATRKGGGHYPYYAACNFVHNCVKFYEELARVGGTELVERAKAFHGELAPRREEAVKILELLPRIQRLNPELVSPYGVAFVTGGKKGRYLLSFFTTDSVRYTRKMHRTDPEGTVTLYSAYKTVAHDPHVAYRYLPAGPAILTEGSLDDVLATVVAARKDDAARKKLFAQLRTFQKASHEIVYQQA